MRFPAARNRSSRPCERERGLLDSGVEAPSNASTRAYSSLLEVVHEHKCKHPFALSPFPSKRHPPPLRRLSIDGRSGAVLFATPFLNLMRLNNRPRGRTSRGYCLCFIRSGLSFFFLFIDRFSSSKQGRPRLFQPPGQTIWHSGSTTDRSKLEACMQQVSNVVSVQRYWPRSQVRRPDGAYVLVLLCVGLGFWYDYLGYIIGLLII